MKRKKIEVNYKPLRQSIEIVEVGTVTSVQTYDAVTEEYGADYTLTPLVLFPRCGVYDIDKDFAARTINSQLSGFTWTEIVNGVRKEIDSTTQGYTLEVSGASKGSIKINKNAQLASPITLEFKGEYLDTRMGQIITFRASKLIQCVNATEAAPQVFVDSDSTHLYDPVNDTAEQKITASLMVGETNVTSQTEKRKFFWFYLNDDGMETPLTEDCIEVVSLQDNELVIDRQLIGEKQTYIVKANYNSSGNPSVQANGSSSIVTTTIVRRLPKFDYDIVNVPTRIATDVEEIYPKVLAQDTNGTMPAKFYDEVKIVWYKDSSVLTVCKEPTISVADATTGLLGVECVDRGNYKILTNSEGKAITDASGKIIICR